MKTHMIPSIALSLLFSSGMLYAQSPETKVVTQEAQTEVEKVNVDRGQLQQDKLERKEAQGKVDAAKEKLAADKKSGASKEVLKADRQALKKVRQARNEKHQQVKADKKALGMEMKDRTSEKTEDKK